MDKHSVFIINQSQAADAGVWANVANEFALLKPGHAPIAIPNAEGKIVGQIAGTHSSAQVVQYKHANKGPENAAIIVLDHSQISDVNNADFMQAIENAINSASATIKTSPPKPNAGLNGAFSLVTGNVPGGSDQQFEMPGILAGLALPGRVTTVLMAGPSVDSARASDIMVYPIHHIEADGTPVLGATPQPMGAVA